MSEQLITVTKDGEWSEIHPSTLQSHIDAGWEIPLTVEQAAEHFLEPKPRKKAKSE